MNSSINSLIGEILQVPGPNVGNGKEREREVQGGRIQMHQVMMGKIKEMAREISVLGAEDVKEMEEENKGEAKKRAKIAEFFTTLDEED